MDKILNRVFFFCLLFALNIFGGLHAEEFSLKLNYSLIADKFHWLDQVSNSAINFFQISDYRKNAESCWEFDDNDLLYLERYRVIRKKYQNEDAINELYLKSLFAPDPSIVVDPIVDAFYSSDTLEQAVKKLSKTLLPEEIFFLENIFKHFEMRFEKVILNKDLVQSILQALNHYLSKSEIKDFFKQVENFYNARSEKIKTVHLFSAPEGYMWSGASCGHHLCLRIPSNFVLSVEDSVLMSSILVHEAIHHISGSASEKQKEKFSQVFRQTVEEVSLLTLEEPLVIAMQLYFIKKYYPERFERAESWFFFPLAREYFFILEEYLNAGRNVDEGFMERCAEACSNRE